MIVPIVLRLFGYVKVPPEAVELAVRARLTWEKEPRHPMVGEVLKALEELLRSTR